MTLDFPPAVRAALARGLTAAFGVTEPDSIVALGGGLSGAGVFRIRVGGIAYLLRLDQARDGFRDPARSYACMRIAAAGLLAPRVRYADAEDGVAIMDFIDERPLSLEYRGTPEHLVVEAAQTVRALHAGPPFPPLVDYLELMERRLAGLVASGRFMAGALDPHCERLAAIRLARQEDPPSLAPSHNDPNRGNILFDGQRLWLIDWESAYRNDPFVDVAIVLDSLASGPAFEAGLLEAWLGRAPDATDRRRLELARSLARLYMACFLLDIGPPAAAASAVDALDPADVRRSIIAGRLVPGTPETAQALGRIYLSGFLTGAPMPGLTAAVAAAMGLPTES